jgi:hypothetical protein
MDERWAIYFAVTGFLTVALGCLAGMWAMGMHIPLARASVPLVQGPAALPAIPPQTAPQMAPQRNAIVASPMQAVPPPGVDADQAYYARLRSQIHWVPTRLGRDVLMAPDFASRVLLAKSAAQRAGLGEVGLGFKDVYGVITAETSWMPRAGLGRDGAVSYGVAQFERATARAIGLRDPNDIVEAVHAAARHMKEGAEWSRARIAGLRLDDREHAQRLRDGVSIYYNLSSRGRAAWNGRNTEALPMPTRQHIQNARVGALEAAFLEVQMHAMQYGAQRSVAVAGGGDTPQ